METSCEECGGKFTPRAPCDDTCDSCRLKAAEARVSELEAEVKNEVAKRVICMRQLQLLECRASPIPCACGCEGCRADREEMRALIGDWRKEFEAVDDGKWPAPLTPRQLRADCVQLIPITNGIWAKGVEASPGATHEVWSVESPDYDGEDGYHHGDIRIGD